MRRVNSIIATTFSLALSACLAGCSGGTPFVPPPPVQPPTNNSSVPNTATASGYTLSLWVKAPLSTQKPDSIIYFNNTIYIGYQNAGDVKDGSDPTLKNTIVQYDLGANLLKQYTVPGHNDGLMGRSDTNEL